MQHSIVSPFNSKSCITLALILLPIISIAAQESVPVAQPQNIILAGNSDNDASASVNCSCVESIHMFFNKLDGNNTFQFCVNPNKLFHVKKPNGEIETFFPNTPVKSVKNQFNLGPLTRCRCSTGNCGFF